MMQLVVSVSHPACPWPAGSCGGGGGSGSGSSATPTAAVWRVTTIPQQRGTAPGGREASLCLLLPPLPPLLPYSCSSSDSGCGGGVDSGRLGQGGVGLEEQQMVGEAGGVPECSVHRRFVSGCVAEHTVVVLVVAAAHAFFTRHTRCPRLCVSRLYFVTQRRDKR
ncbi:hypothetical protein E2C01_018678 [Portunus trituberculatus]|uniref:Uncharacterized protein n=1 Tax=Portunus trituberculatus TaxID=210409 RepID=A0A5B7DVN4_PORTR|nr:hypothetical protein [Portunus trituberculatus]